MLSLVVAGSGACRGFDARFEKSVPFPVHKGSDSPFESLVVNDAAQKDAAHPVTYEQLTKA
jgi:hypothetical protein